MENIELIVFLSILVIYCLVKIIQIGKSESLMSAMKSAPKFNRPKNAKAHKNLS